MKICGLIFLVFLFMEKAIGQNPLHADSTIFYLSSQAHYGFILPHSSSIRALVQDTNPWGLSLELSRLRYTQSAWNACNCYSQNGLAVIYFNFDNPEVLGSSMSLAVFAEPHLTYNTIDISLRAGIGLTYLTKVHHPESNPDNVLFSRKLSGILLLQLTSRVWVSENFGIRFSLAYHHISNGGNRQPNLGMNFPTAGIGVEHSIGRIGLVSRKKQFVPEGTLQYYAGVFFATRKVETTDDKSKPVLGLSGGFFKPIARMHGMGAEIEMMNDWSLKEQKKQSPESIDHFIVSGLLRHHFLFGKFDFSQALGFYLYKRYPTQDNIFQRYVLAYRIKKHLEIGFSLKAHLAVAEQMDVRVNYLF
jgi:hypothetical protein